jgi:AraC-like DNA-binding protein
MIEKRRYLSDRLRLWRVGAAGGPTWRASLKIVHNGEQVGFASLEDLFHSLRKETGMLPGADRER